MEMVSRVPKIEGPKFDSMLNATMQASITSCVWHVAMAIVTDMLAVWQFCVEIEDHFIAYISITSPYSK